MRDLAPSILAADFNRLGEQISEIEKAGVRYLHIDVMDGIFVPSISFGMPVVASIRQETGMFFDVHMMVTQPQRYVEEFAKSGADGITIHVEACDCIPETLQRIKALGCKAGIALNPKTPVAEIVPYLDMADLVLVMTVQPGFGGQSYLPECMDKIREVRELLTKRGSAARLEIDGGVNQDNLAANLEAGADVIVAGSAVFRQSITQRVQEFTQIMNEVK